HPVQTYVLEHDWSILSDAIRKELRRGGQVYYLHNRVENIDQCAGRIGTLVPDARIAVAHGKMGEEELSEVWRKLMEGEIDVLVCTTIIETGVDVSNCNTLIIEDADHMGLSQLYQLRGRVGRSSRRAYAYMTPAQGADRYRNQAPRAIREFTKFGSGFGIAMRDLEIRGAGSILGTRQHGHMEAVGYEMYLRLLSEAVSEQRGEKPAGGSSECMVDIRIGAHIPESYIDDLSQRIDIYKRIAAIGSQEDALDVVDELIDRYGEPPAAVKGLIDVAAARRSRELGISESSGRTASCYSPKSWIWTPRAGLRPRLETA
ncbi:MAG: TRCF domain-containing protein, partial [Oscillospiraceae bacterium]